MPIRSTFVVARVIDRDPETARVKVLIQGSDELPSAWLPVVASRAFQDKTYWLPDLGEQVVCLFDADAEFGVVLGSIYFASSPPPVNDGDTFHVAFSDGTTVEYSRATHNLRIVLVAADANVEITTTGDVTFTVPDEKNIFLGSADGAQQLATREFVESIYQLHKHATPAGLSGPPLPIGGETNWPNVTERAVGR